MEQRTEYPRPQFRREEWLPLNGEWQFAYDDDDSGLKRGYDAGRTEFPLRIHVPFTYQYAASGIGAPSRHERVWYRRTFTPRRDRRALLCFNGSDYITDVWVNGKHAISHTGGYTPFSADVTELLCDGENVIVVRCFDPFDPTYPRGKQSWTGERFGCWYLPNTGIWQSVWIDYFKDDCIGEYLLLPDFDECSVSGEIVALRGLADEAEIEVSFCGEEAGRACLCLEGGRADYRIRLLNGAIRDHAWTPEHPNLFEAKFRLYRKGICVDEAHTRFGLRKICVEGDRILLNNEPFYQRLILDQGYWTESGATPPSAAALRKDIELAMAMGFNGARKHQKWEDPYFYYYAEELGFVTWCEMPSAYRFCADEMQKLIREWSEIVSAARNFTSVLCYVPLNESWGTKEIAGNADQQNFARALYYLTKAFDGSRLVSTNDGWECPAQTDVIGIHDYAYDGSLFGEKYRKENYDALIPQGRRLMCENNRYGGQPVLLTEFGGIALMSDTVGGNWGYNDGAASVEEFYTRYGNLLRAIRKQGEFKGFCYTQLTDVQQEVNGLLFADRTPKFELAKIKSLTEGSQERI